MAGLASTAHGELQCWAPPRPLSQHGGVVAMDSGVGPRWSHTEPRISIANHYFNEILKSAVAVRSVSSDQQAGPSWHVDKPSQLHQ